MPAILFAASVAHAEALAAALTRAGIASKALSGSAAPPEREKALSGLRSGAVKVLCSVDLVSEGLDVPAVGAVILLRPTKSLALYLQQVGRGLRPAPGKAALVVLDHAGNSIIHGMPDAPRRWTLESRSPRAPTKARTSKAFCRSCASTLRRSAEACRSCGTPVHPLEPPTAGAASTLVEVTAAAANRMNALRSAPVQDLLREVRTVADLVAIQRARGFKPGWVWHQWNALTGRDSP